MNRRTRVGYTGLNPHVPRTRGDEPNAPRLSGGIVSPFPAHAGMNQPSNSCEVDQFHGRTESLIKQELFAHFNLIALTRCFTNRDAALCQAAGPADGKPPPRG